MQPSWWRRDFLETEYWIICPVVTVVARWQDVYKNYISSKLTAAQSHTWSCYSLRHCALSWFLLDAPSVKARVEKAKEEAERWGTRLTLRSATPAAAANKFQLQRVWLSISEQCWRDATLESPLQNCITTEWSHNQSKSYTTFHIIKGNIGSPWGGDDEAKSWCIPDRWEKKEKKR